MANKQAAADFEKIIHDSRDRKKNEALAARIFGKDRRASGEGLRSSSRAAGGSLASRAGINKRSASNPATSRRPARTIDGEWAHDLHDGGSYRAGAGSAGASSLAHRITDPNAPPTGPRSQRRRAVQVSRALTTHADRNPAGYGSTNGGGNGNSSSNGTDNRGRAPPTGPAATRFNPGMSIRGLAGPFAVMAQNFAPGTTAADIESAMTPVGGVISSCRLLKASPIVVAEIVFESKEGADNVVATFHNQTADGRILSVYHKLGGASSPSPNPAGGVRQNGNVVDGTLGFSDPMDGVDGAGYPNGGGGGGSGLYSDGMVWSGRNTVGGGGGIRGGWGPRR